MEKTKMVNQILEYMLSMYVMHYQNMWEEYLTPIKFSYNKNNQESLRMSSFEALYGGSCNTPIN